MKKYLFFLLLIILLACNKDDTQPQHNTFRCKVNGMEWKATTYRGGGIFGMGVQGPTDIQYYKDTKSFSLGAVREFEDQSINQSIAIYKGRNTQIGSNKMTFRKEVFQNWSNQSGCKFYDLDTLKKHELIILHIDTINYVIEGEFEFSAFNDCGDTVHITEGYFDLDYRF